MRWRVVLGAGLEAVRCGGGVVVFAPLVAAWVVNTLMRGVVVVGGVMVHAVTSAGVPVIRVDSVSQWFVQELDRRRRVSLAEAVALACEPGAVCFLGLRGGGSFDVGVRRQQRLSGASQV